MTLANLPYKAPFIKHFDVGISHPKPPKRWVIPNSTPPQLWPKDPSAPVRGERRTDDAFVVPSRGPRGASDPAFVVRLVQGLRDGANRMV